MKNDYLFAPANSFGMRLSSMSMQRKTMVGAILMIALLAFEMFNFDTTQFALRSLLGDIRFAGLQWASILAIAFCSIDFAGLIRIFTPERGADEPPEVWYLMGAWLLGAAMNAVMTWWAVSLTLLNHTFGNEILSREQLLTYVPIFVAVLVWLTRILFIGAFTVAGEHIFDFGNDRAPAKKQSRARKQAPSTRRKAAPRRVTQPARTAVSRTTHEATYEPLPMSAAPQTQPMQRTVPQRSVPQRPAPQRSAPHRPAQRTTPQRPAQRPATATSPVVRRQNSRVRQRPPVPGSANMGNRMPMKAQGKEQH
ncbi:MAG: hypothetical protein AAF614_15995 [Chloroflexota bacterium]